MFHRCWQKPHSGHGPLTAGAYHSDLVIPPVGEVCAHASSCGVPTILCQCRNLFRVLAPSSERRSTNESSGSKHPVALLFPPPIIHFRIDVGCSWISQGGLTVPVPYPLQLDGKLPLWKKRLSGIVRIVVKFDHPLSDSLFWMLPGAVYGKFSFPSPKSGYPVETVLCNLFVRLSTFCIQRCALVRYSSAFSSANVRSVEDCANDRCGSWSPQRRGL